MRIGELAAASGSSVETIRYYEREGLLAPPARTGSNYRAYTSAHAERLAFIRRCRALDMTLDEVRALLRFRDAPQSDCREVNALIDEHIGHVARRIRELRGLEKELRVLRAACTWPDKSTACGILHGIEASVGDVAPAQARRHVRGTH